MKTQLKTRNGIPQLNSSRRLQMAININEGLLRELREMAARTGLSQRSIVEAGTRRQLSELNRQIAKGQLAVTGDISDE